METSPSIYCEYNENGLLLTHKKRPNVIYLSKLPCVYHCIHYLEPQKQSCYKAMCKPVPLPYLDEDSGTTATRRISRCFMLKYVFCRWTRQRIHSTLIVVDRYLRLMEDKAIPDSTEPRLESFYPQFVVGIGLPHKGVVDCYNPFKTFNGTRVEIWEWISNSCHTFNGVITYPCCD